MQNFRLTSTLFVIALLLLPDASTQAQDSVYTLYYEDETPNRLDFTLLTNNVCLEAVLRLNPDLDINDIAYGERVDIPVDEPCYQYDQSFYGWWNFGNNYPPRLKYYENDQWLDEPYYSENVVYIRPDSVDDIAHQYNICLDDLLADNILLQDFERYQAYAIISLDIFIPKDAPPCDPNWTEPADLKTTATVEIPANEITPLYFVQQYNLCVEAVWRQAWRGYLYLQQTSAQDVTFQIPDDALPCYNEAGQRLSYYDEQGRPLEQLEYSDLDVYIAPPGQTMPAIAEQFGVCLIDLLRVNHFPDMPLVVPIEVFIPQTRPCPDEITARLIRDETADLDYISLYTNICSQDLLPLNPHFSETANGWTFANRLFFWNDRNMDKWIITPQDAESCYQQYHPRTGDSIFDIERSLNVCYEEFRRERYVSFDTIIPHDRVTLYISFDVPPCYNEDGQRLQYSTTFANNLKERMQEPVMQYSEMPIYIFQPEDTAYAVSKLHNVCVRDLLDVNPLLVSQMPTGYPTFIPQTRPCYDEITGMSLIYEDETGSPLPEPKVSDQLVYYGSQPLGRVSFYYNVCLNRIEDANRAKFDRESNYLGWIIPTDRPPCYDAAGSPIHYVCYNQPIDHSQIEQSISFNIDGTFCYDLSQPETVVWQENKPYRVIPYQDTMLSSRAFTAWCFGVSLAEIDAINEDPDVLSILPFQSRAIPLPTRACYIEHPEILVGNEVYTVEPDDTLISIARRYDKPYQWIARINDLDGQNTIWAGQVLIIPAGPTLSSLYALAGLCVLAIVSSAGLYWRKRQRSKPAP